MKSFDWWGVIRSIGVRLAPYLCEDGSNLRLEADDQLAIAGDKPLLYFNLGHNFLLHGEWRNWNRYLLQYARLNSINCCPRLISQYLCLKFLS